MLIHLNTYVADQPWHAMITNATQWLRGLSDFCLCPVKCEAYLTGVKKSDKFIDLRDLCELKRPGGAGERKGID